MPQPRPGYPAVLAARVNLRPYERDSAASTTKPASQTREQANVAPDALGGAGRRISAAFTQSPGRGEKLSAPRLDSWPFQGRLEWDTPTRPLDELGGEPERTRAFGRARGGMADLRRVPAAPRLW